MQSTGQLHRLPYLVLSSPLMCAPLSCRCSATRPTHHLATQVLISLAFCITTGLALAGLAGFYHWFNQPGRYNTVTSDWKLTQKEVNNVKTGLVGGMVSSLLC